MVRDDIFCIILAGGSGTRLWPLSQQRMPKQFVDVMGVGRTMLQITYDRYLRICKPENFVIVTVSEYLPIVRQQLPQVPADHVLAEPFKRNTAASVAFANAFVRQFCASAVTVVAPSDHIILDNDIFVDSVAKSADYAAQHPDQLLTIGIKASRPDTAFGYIQVGDAIDDAQSLHSVRTFTEKPGAEMAQTFFECGDFCWNSGVCVWALPAIDAALGKFMPHMQSLFCELDSMPVSHWTYDVVRRIYDECENTSISYGVMEKARNVVVCLSSAAWSDIGSWDSVYEQGAKDDAGNVVLGAPALLKNSKGCLIHVEDGNVCVVDGLEDYVVAQRGHIIMVCPRGSAHNSWRYVAELKAEVE